MSYFFFLYLLVTLSRSMLWLCWCYHSCYSLSYNKRGFRKKRRSAAYNSVPLLLPQFEQVYEGCPMIRPAPYQNRSCWVETDPAKPAPSHDQNRDLFAFLRTIQNIEIAVGFLFFFCFVRATARTIRRYHSGPITRIDCSSRNNSGQRWFAILETGRNNNNSRTTKVLGYRR